MQPEIRDVIGRPVGERIGKTHLFIVGKEAHEDHVPNEVVYSVVRKLGDAIFSVISKRELYYISKS
jgi:hypothetical protein